MNLRAVIIDDEYYIRDVIRALGHWEDLEISVVGEAADGEAGLELIRQLAPEIVISDVKMPRLDGLELASKLQDMDIPPQVIIVSGYDDYGLVRQALKCGVSDYLLKPIKEEELNEQLAACKQAVMSRSENSGKNKVWKPKLESKPWFLEFRSAQKEFPSLLRRADEEMISKRFAALKQAIKGETTLPEAIYCYYALMAVLESFLIENACSLADVVDESEANYVFGSGDEISYVLEFSCDLYCKAAAKVENLNKRLNKLDIAAVKQYIDKNYTQNISLQTAANCFYVSREYLSRSFKNEYGMGFSDYLLACRMERAKELLTEYHAPIKDVWQMLGFAEQAHFYKCFKKYFGMTPGEVQSGQQNTIQDVNSR